MEPEPLPRWRGFFKKRLFGGENAAEREIRMIMDAGGENGGIEESEKEMINNIFELDDRTVAELMTHRTEIEYLTLETPLEGVIQLAVESGYSRIPVCEECGVKMACHPDDPAWPIFGLPRIANCLEDFDKLIELNTSPAHALCVCTGSLASSPDNEIPAIVRYFGEKGRIACMHIRNVKHLGYRRFRESSHLSSDGSLDMYAIVKAVHDTCPDIYIRPDHGRMIWDEEARPGYGLYDRALGAAYLNGLWEAIEKCV